jgi:uncharacterized protein (DUF433 family)
MADLTRIETVRGVMVGKPVIRGTRLTVEIVLRRIADGYSIDDILQDYPHITREDVLSAVAYAADHLERPKTEAAA